MRKTLLLATALCLATTAMAQTSPATALTAQIGNNSYTIGSEKTTVYWKFTADKDYVATIGVLGNSDIPTVSIQDGIKLNEIKGTTASDWTSKIYAFQKGKTYFFTLKDAEFEAGFTLQLEETSNVGAGLSEDNPIAIKLGETQALGNPIYPSTSYGSTNVYATYTAEQDGQLRLTTEQGVSSATVNGNTVSADYEGGKRIFKINTTAGETYKINFSISVPIFIITSEVVQVKAGSLDMPFNLNNSEFTVPAEAGKYYYTYNPEKKGYINITSDAALTDGQVKVFRNKLNASADKYALATSEVGSYNLRTEIASTAYTYYIVVDKKQTTDNDETFNFAFEDYQPGEVEDNPIAITVGETLDAVTLPSANGTYYYSITVPANTDKFLVVEATSALSSNSSATLYPKGGSAWGAPTMENGILKKAVNNEDETTYILKFVSSEENPISFKVSYADIEKGSIITSPKEAIAGNNTIDFDGTEYYIYTATKDGKLAVTASDGTEVTFPQGTGQYDGYYDTYQKGNVYFIEATKGTEYLITVSGANKGATFSLEETDFQAGEIRSNPIVMDGNTYTFGKDASSLWLKYTVKKDGIIDFSCDIPFSDENLIGIATNDDEAISMADYDSSDIPEYKGTLTVSAGDVLYIQVMLTGDMTGKTITLTEREAEVGETYLNPIVLEKGKTIDIPNASTKKSVWVKVTIPEGESKFRLSGGDMNLKVFANEYSIKSDEGMNVPMDEVEMPDGSLAYEFTLNSWMDNSVRWFKIMYTTNEPKLTFVDEATDGITNIETGSNSQVSIYDLTGKKVNQISGNGVYIIKANGKTQKVVIKK